MTNEKNDIKPLNKRRVGKFWERKAADYLRLNGFQILYMNYRTRYSEIDIIAQDREALVFVEVKYRSSTKAGDPLEAVDARKIQQIRRTALKYMHFKGYNPESTSIRFDCIGITGSGINHVENAF